MNVDAFSSASEDHVKMSHNSETTIDRVKKREDLKRYELD